MGMLARLGIARGIDDDAADAARGAILDRRLDALARQGDDDEPREETPEQAVEASSEDDKARRTRAIIRKRARSN